MIWVLVSILVLNITIVCRQHLMLRSVFKIRENQTSLMNGLAASLEYNLAKEEQNGTGDHSAKQDAAGV